MSRLGMVLAALALVALAGCAAPTPGPDELEKAEQPEKAGKAGKKHGKHALERQGGAAEGGAACEKKTAALEAEVARLERQAKGEPAPAYKIINGHEHLMTTEDFERYRLAAKAAGIVATVMVASPAYTLLGKGNEKGEPSMSQNFEELLEAALKYPGEILPFTTVDPTDPEKLERLKRHVAAGAKGVKLYSGHGNFFDKPLDDPAMDPIYGYLEQQGLPLCWHINLLEYFSQFENVMKAHPKLNVQVPHYGVAFWKPDSEYLEQAKRLLRTYPNLFLDTSLGTRKILVDGLTVMGKSRKVFQDLIKEFPDRITFGTDGVVTDNDEKTTDWWAKVIGACRDQLERESFYFAMGAAYSRYYHKGMDPSGTFVGLALPPEVLKKIYEDNPARWLAGPHPKG